MHNLATVYCQWTMLPTIMVNPRWQVCVSLVNMESCFRVVWHIAILFAKCGAHCGAHRLIKSKGFL